MSDGKTIKRKLVPISHLDARVELPGSKYMANRLVVIAALAERSVTLRNVVSNDDINTAIEGLSSLGYNIQRIEQEVHTEPREKALAQPASVYTAHSGTFSRFVTAVAALENVPVTINGSEKMNTRPMAPLFSALRELGVSVESNTECLPATLKGPMSGDQCSIDASKSSQFVSALLLAAPTLPHSLSVQLTGEQVSTQYIDMTVALMEQFGAKVEKSPKGDSYRVIHGHPYGSNAAGQLSNEETTDVEQAEAKNESREPSRLCVTIPPDPVSSSYFMGLAAIHGGAVELASFDFDSLQGESKFYRVLEAMGCEVTRLEQSLRIERRRPLKAVEFDMGEMPDVVQTMAAIACFAEGTTVMKNIAHLAYKESNRIVDTARELQKLGATVEFGADYLSVTGGCALTGTQIETYDDHRMAMSLALIGSKIPDVVINDSQVVSKSFPTYFDKLAELGIGSELV